MPKPTLLQHARQHMSKREYDHALDCVLQHAEALEARAAREVATLQSSEPSVEPASVPEDELSELQRLCEQASAGPWELDEVEWCINSSDHELICYVPDDLSTQKPSKQTRHNAAFLAAARAALPKLIGRVRQLQAQLDAQRNGGEHG